MMKLKLVTVLLLPCMLACQDNVETGQLSNNSVDVMKLLPEETNILVYANVQSLRDSEFGDQIYQQIDSEAKIGEDDEYAEFKNATGLDLERDIDELWFAGLVDAQQKTFGGAVVRGSFDRDRITEYIKTEQKHQENIEYEGHTIYMIDDDDGEPKGLLFWDNKTALFGEERWLKTLIDNDEQNRHNVLHNTTMAACVKDLPYKQHLWGVFNLKELSGKWAEQIREKGSMFKGSKSIENMETFVFATRMQDKADVYIRGMFATTEEAEMLANMLNGFKAMAKLMVSDDKEAIDMLNEISIKAKEKELLITTEIHKEFIEKVQQKRRTFAQGDTKMMF